MDQINEELIQVREICESHCPGSKVISCVPQMVRIDIMHSTHKKLTACLQFSEDYPKTPLLIELKSTSLGDKLLCGLAKLGEQECMNHLNKPQILRLVRFLKKFLVENSLCVCHDELATIKKELWENTDELKLKQKHSSIHLKFFQRDYYFSAKIVVPNEYPDQRVELENIKSNFPAILTRWIVSQAKEIARQCVTPPLKKNPKAPPFVVKPSLLPVVNFILEEIRRLPLEPCTLCKEKGLPDNPTEVVENSIDDKYLERVYCGHLFHYGCINAYMKTPPFRDGKPCPICKKLIYHHRWRDSASTVEQRWAHKEAKKRELEEVVDFLQ